MNRGIFLPFTCTITKKVLFDLPRNPSHTTYLTVGTETISHATHTDRLQFQHLTFLGGDRLLLFWDRCWDREDLLEEEFEFLHDSFMDWEPQDPLLEL